MAIYPLRPHGQLTALVVAAVFALGTTACSRPRPHDLASQGGLWAVDIAGIKIGQTCQSAHARFRSAGWTYGVGAWTSIPEHPELVGGEYSRPGELVDFGCANTADGPRVSMVQYTPKPDFMSQQQLIATALKKFGRPALQFSMAPGWTMYRWGDMGATGQEDFNRGKAKPFVDLSIEERGSYRDTFLEANAGSNWAQQQSNAIDAAKNAALHRAEKPSLQ